MYEQFKTEILVKVGHLPSDILEEFCKAMDTVACSYTIKPAETAIAVIGREQFFQIAGAYVFAKM